MNIAEKLKYYPKGTKLYSPIFGELILNYVVNGEVYSICCITEEGIFVYFTSNGRLYCEYPHAECVLFPSKDQHDWNKLGIYDQETKHQFKPFDKVLVRDDDDTTWRCDFFSHLGDKEGVFICLTTWWHQCIPYEGNEHLLGTTNNPEE